jgi:hypothetical protein
MIPNYARLPQFNVEPYIMIDHDVKYIHKDSSTSVFPEGRNSIQFRSRDFEMPVKDDIIFARKIYYVNTAELPPVVEGRIYIVSKIVASLLAGHRNDFAYPGTHPKYDGAEIKNSKVTAVKRFRLPDFLVLEERDEIKE